jgi:SAM-dependent methyltransferase
MAHCGPIRSSAPPSAATAWDRAAQRALARPYLDPALAAAKQAAHLSLLDRWVPDLRDLTVLKTDLWEEGVAGDELLFSLAARAQRAIGVDASPVVVSAAAERSREVDGEVLIGQGDVRALPVPDASVDVIVSTSTIDHLEEGCDRHAAMAEMRRVLRPGGQLVLTVDNADNIGDSLLRMAAAIGAVPFPLDGGMSLAALEEFAARAGFRVEDSAYLVPAPRVVTTGLVRLARLLPNRSSGPAVARVGTALDALGERWPRRCMAFVAVRSRLA